MQHRGQLLPIVYRSEVRCVRGSIPASTLDTLCNDLGLNRAPAETILRKTHLAACEHMRRMIHTRRAIEALTVGPQGIITKLFQRDNMRRGRPPHGNAPPNTSRPRRPNGEEISNATWRFGVSYMAFSFLINIPLPTYSQSHVNLTINTSKHTPHYRHSAKPFDPWRQDGTSLPPGVFQILDYRRPSGQ
jgi:hypothetical protein